MSNISGFSALRGRSLAAGKRQRGMTLIELMIAIVIVAILAGIAVPTYTDYVLRTNRMDAINSMLELAACQERIYIKQNSYANDRCNLTSGSLTSQEGNYTIALTLQAVGGTAAQGFNLVATPVAKQSKDSCGNMTLTERGVKGASKAGDDAAITDCWKGRKI